MPASLGTLGVVTSDGAAYGSLTTPDPITLHETLDRLAGEGVTHLAMEASSHGIDQRRLDGVRLAAAASPISAATISTITARTEAYAAAKLRLFETLLPTDAPAVINADGAYRGRLHRGRARARPAGPRPRARRARSSACVAARAARASAST